MSLYRSLSFVFFAASISLSAIGAEPPRMVVHPKDHGKALLNPGMGWVFHHFDNSIRAYGPPLGPKYAGEGFPGLNVAYLRLGWSYLEPEEGKFNWSVIDTVARRYIEHGRKIALRLTCFESEIRFATPRWVKDAGARGYWWVYGQGRVDTGDDPKACWEPDYEDPVFLEKLERFLAAAGERYDGDSAIIECAFVDVGTIGIWGEGNPVSRRYDVSTYKRHIDLHHKYFPNTLLAAQDDWHPGPMRPTFHERGMVETSFHIDGPWGESPGSQFDVLIGLWEPTAKDMPDGRFLPAGGQADRRILVGRILVDDRGKATYERVPASSEVSTEADYQVEPGQAQRRGRSFVLPMRWKIVRDLRPGTSPFCHLEREGQTVYGAGLATTWGPIHEYALQQGLTLRDDSVMWRKGFTYNSDWMAEKFWRTKPVIIESGHYSPEIWGDGETYLEAMEAYHASYVSIHGDPRVILKNHADLIHRMNHRIGYRLQLVEASWPKKVSVGKAISWRAKWRNVGVAPLYQGGIATVTLKRINGTIVAVLPDVTLDLGRLPVAAPDKAQAYRQEVQLALPKDISVGQLDLFISVGAGNGTPQIALPLKNADGQRRYRLGTITLTSRGSAR